MRTIVINIWNEEQVDIIIVDTKAEKSKSFTTTFGELNTEWLRDNMLEHMLSTKFHTEAIIRGK